MTITTFKGKFHTTFIHQIIECGSCDRRKSCTYTNQIKRRSSGSYSKLQIGSSGTAVRNLQYTLYELKYYDGNITGTFDEATANAVTLFQQVNGLAIDGVAGVQTQSILYSSAAKPNNL